MVSSHPGDTLNFDVALALHQRGQLGQAEALYTHILHRQEDPRCWQNLGVLYRQTGRQALAVASYRKALALQPDQAGILSNLGNALKDLDRLDEAVEYTAKAVQQEPDSIKLRHNYAISLREAKRFQEALEQLDLCLAAQPDNAGLQWDRAFVLLYLQDYQKAWPAFESRWRTGDLPEPNIPESCKRWQGEAFQGKKLLLLTEQGFGDTLFAARYIPLVVGLGGEVVLECKAPLQRLFSGLPVTLITPEDARDDMDLYCPLMSLPGLFPNQTPEPVPLAVPSTAGSEALAVLRQNKNRLRVGIIWSGSTTYGDNNRRSVSIEHFLPLVEQHPDIDFFSLQKGPREADRISSGLHSFLPDLGSKVHDFADTAKVLEQLDLLLMTDSATAHLAGSLGVPVLNLLQYKPYWLYYPETHTTHWYSSMRFIRQLTPGCWDTVFDCAGKILQDLKYSGSGCPPETILKTIDGHLS